MKKIEDTPKIMHIGGWTAAVIGAAVFAVAVGVFMYRSANAPIEASKEQTNCPENEQIAINNYPGDNIVFNSKVNYFTRMGQNWWQCSKVCVSGYDRTKSYGEANNRKVLDEYLKDKTYDGYRLDIVENGADFDTKVADDNKMYAVIRSSTKNNCVGPDSDDYDLKTTSGEIIQPVEKNTTFQDNGAGDDDDDPTAEGTPKPFPIPGSGDGNTATVSDKAKFEKCASSFSRLVLLQINKLKFNQKQWDHFVVSAERFNSRQIEFKQNKQLESDTKPGAKLIPLTKKYLDLWLGYCEAETAKIKSGDFLAEIAMNLGLDPDSDAQVQITISGAVAVSNRQCSGYDTSGLLQISEERQFCNGTINNSSVLSRTHVCAYVSGPGKNARKTLADSIDGTFGISITTTEKELSRLIELNLAGIKLFAVNKADQSFTRNIFLSYHPKDLTQTGKGKYLLRVKPFLLFDGGSLFPKYPFQEYVNTEAADYAYRKSVKKSCIDTNF